MGDADVPDAPAGARRPDGLLHRCLRTEGIEAGRDPHDKGIQDLVGELSTRSDLFRTLWAAHDVRTHGSGTKRFTPPVVGELTLVYEELAITAEPGQVMLIYSDIVAYALGRRAAGQGLDDPRPPIPVG